MKLFLIRLSVFLILQILILMSFWGFRVRHEMDDNHYLMAWRDKHDRLAQVPSPRLVLVGGSNLAMGIDSQALESSLGRSVINLGLNAGLGMEFILREAESGVRKGDVAIVSPEYFLMYSQDPPSVLLDLLSLEPRALRFVNWSTLRELLEQGLIYLGRLPKSTYHYWKWGDVLKSTGIYTRGTFNVHGDATLHRGLTPPRPIRERETLYFYNESGFRRGINRLNQFGERCRKSGADVFFAYPPIPKEEDFNTFKPKLDHLEEIVRTELHMKILHSAEDVAFPTDWFFDTGNHLTMEGTRIRTNLLITRLSRALGPNPDGIDGRPR